MVHSVRNKVIASFVITMAVVIAVACLGAYAYVHWHERQISDEMGLIAAQACASMLEFVDEDSGILDPDSEDYKDCREAMRELCMRNRMDYMYAYRCDVETGEITYLFCVADDALNDEMVALERPFGAVVGGGLSEQELSALAGHETNEPLELNNQFGQMLAWFCKVDGWSGEVLAGADYAVNEQRDRTILATAQIVSFVFVALFVLLFIQLRVLRKHVFEPIRIISERMRTFSAESAGEFEPLDISTRDEMGEIAKAFSKMAKETDAYLKDIEHMTSERVQTRVEMDVTRRIQLGMVPERTNVTGSRFEICAIARTAREVGGDFYDCLVTDDGRVAVAVGDVSGKGVAASLFMVLAKTMIHDSLALGKSPAATLNEVNENLRQSNPEGMFITVFAAVYDPITGVVRFANAGHMPPLLIGDDVRILDVDPGVLLGLFEGAELVEGVVQLAKDETLLMYTDGVTEAVNPEGAFFGEERFAAAMRAHAPYPAAQDLADEVVTAVKAFVKDREQFDDLTLLALRRVSEPVELSVDIASFSTVRESIMAAGLDEGIKLKACLACEEAFVNVVSYSRADHMWYDVVDDGTMLHVVLIDDGDPFDPTSTAVEKKDFDDLEDGGMGIDLVRQLATDLRYRRESGRNILIIEISAV